MILENLAKPTLDAVAVLFRYFWKRPRLRMFCGWGHEPNENKIGNHLVLWIKIANPTTESIYFERLDVRKSNGDYFLPSINGIEVGDPIYPSANAVVRIPCGHVCSQDITSVRVYDALENIHELKGKRLKKSIAELMAEKERLEGLGFSVHPSNPYP